MHASRSDSLRALYHRLDPAAVPLARCSAVCLDRDTLAPWVRFTDAAEMVRTLTHRDVVVAIQYRLKEC